jgi:hypothetical protein
MFKDLAQNFLRDATSSITSELREKARSIVPFANGSSRGFMSSVRGRNLPADGMPNFRTSTEAVIADTRKDNDWRVSLSIPPVITKLENTDILNPLKVTGNRMIFPFTPSVIFSHSASYSAQNPVHSNYPFYSYGNSSVDAITISGDFFTETNEDAEYWVAAVTFLRTMTKMFYGDGANSGNPPPICKLNGYGEYVFKNVPCVITSFNIDMPQDVDYFKTTVRSTGEPSNESAAGTWVPAQSLIAVTVQPVYSRTHVEQFNLNDFVSGKLITTRGFI